MLLQSPANICDPFVTGVVRFRRWRRCVRRRDALDSAGFGGEDFVEDEVAGGGAAGHAGGDGGIAGFFGRIDDGKC